MNCDSGRSYELHAICKTDDCNQNHSQQEIIKVSLTQEMCIQRQQFMFNEL